MKFSKIKSLVFTALVAVVLVIGGSAFKPAAGGNYGFNPTTGEWTPIDGLTPVGPLDTPVSGQYKCDPEGDLCRAFFDYDNPEDNASDYVEESNVAGTFILGTGTTAK